MTAAPLLFDRAAGLFIAPIRHHSPACAWHLQALIEAVRPAIILIEGPCDFDPLIPVITDAATVPPVAVVALADRTGDDGAGRRVVSYFPFSRHSPEYVALQAAARLGLDARFIDLPSDDRAMRSGDHDAAQLVDEQVYLSGRYVTALAAELGCRDGNEVWDHLFEARIGAGGWEGFFGDVGLYCAHLRGCTADAAMAADGTLAREAQMRGAIAAARRGIDENAAARRETAGPILAVVGGFHAPALVGASAASETPKPASPKSGAAYLIRYGNRQLNALTGYSAGLPLPGFYDALWGAVRDAPTARPFDALATTLITGFAAHLRTALPASAPALPVLAATIENARRLAALRGRPGPLRDDILDACRSTLLKGEDGGDSHPVLAELLAWLTGSAIGDVPASAGSPPLVEAARSAARRLGFNVGDGERRNRDLDIYREPRHRRASQFLHAMALLETGFGRRTGGPDLRSGVDLDRLHETWSVAWSPMVEARLVELSGTADNVAGAVVAQLASRIAALGGEGRGHDAVAVIALFAAACQAGVGDAIGDVLALIADEIANDPALGNVAAALRDLIGLWRNRAMLGIADPGGIETLLVAAWRRALHLVPDLAQADASSATASLEALLVLREAIELASATLPAIDAALFDKAIAGLIDTTADPTIAGAVHALACLSGHVGTDALAARIVGGLGGAYVAGADKAGFLRGVIAIARELLWGVPELVTEIERLLESLNRDEFIALLPHLRLAFGQLDPREIDRLAQSVAGKLGADPAALTARHLVPESAMPELLAVDAFVAAELALAGLA